MCGAPQGGKAGPQGSEPGCTGRLHRASDHAVSPHVVRSEDTDSRPHETNKITRSKLNSGLNLNQEKT